MSTAPTTAFTLQGYYHDPASPFSVQGALTYEAPWLTVRFHVYGPINTLQIPHLHPAPGRQDRLWEQTCFELFVAPVAAAQYWEINVAPSGHWNTYHFDHYRQGMQREPCLQVSQVMCHLHPENHLTLRFQIDIALLLHTHGLTTGDLEWSPCCILVDRAQQHSYWAVLHQPLRPDFHRRASFLLRLP